MDFVQRLGVFKFDDAFFAGCGKRFEDVGVGFQKVEIGLCLRKPLERGFVDFKKGIKQNAFDFCHGVALGFDVFHQRFVGRRGGKRGFQAVFKPLRNLGQSLQFGFGLGVQIIENEGRQIAV